MIFSVPERRIFLFASFSFSFRRVDVGSESFVQTGERGGELFVGGVGREIVGLRFALRNETAERLVAVRRSARRANASDGQTNLPRSFARRGTFQGKIELELEILNEDEARERPAGRGRESPNENPKLDEPK